MKYIDFGIQTLIFGFAVVLLIMGITEQDWLIYVFLAQLFMGPWQFFSSLISVLVSAELHREKRVHLVLSSIYLAALFVGSTIGQTIEQNLSKEAVLLLVIVPPWLLAGYYYFLTYTWAFRLQRHAGTFLRHINF